MVCPVCGEAGAEVVTGEELEVESITVEEPAAARADATG